MDPEITQDYSSVTPEEYKELVVTRSAIIELKAQKSDVYDFIVDAEAQIANAKLQLAECESKINEKNQELQSRLLDIVKDRGIEGDFSISETEPHYIIPSKPPEA
jgi:hypothetical protein